MRLWRNAGIKGGKFLVLRRDGTVPPWPWFVMGAKDPASPAGLLAYAEKASACGIDPDYVADGEALAEEFEQYRAEHGSGDPDGVIHRTDDPTIVRIMDGTPGV